MNNKIIEWGNQYTMNNNDLQFEQKEEIKRNEKMASIEKINDKECSICLELIIEGADQLGNQLATTLLCDHCFHSQCINRWFSQKQNCPLCRQKTHNSNKTFDNDHIIDDDWGNDDNDPRHDEEQRQRLQRLITATRGWRRLYWGQHYGDIFDI